MTNPEKVPSFEQMDELHNKLREELKHYLELFEDHAMDFQSLNNPIQRKLCKLEELIDAQEQNLLKQRDVNPDNLIERCGVESIKKIIAYEEKLLYDRKVRHDELAKALHLMKIRYELVTTALTNIKLFFDVQCPIDRVRYSLKSIMTNITKVKDWIRDTKHDNKENSKNLLTKGMINYREQTNQNTFDWSQVLSALDMLQSNILALEPVTNFPKRQQAIIMYNKALQVRCEEEIISRMTTMHKECEQIKNAIEKTWILVNDLTFREIPQDMLRCSIGLVDGDLPWVDGPLGPFTRFNPDSYKNAKNVDGTLKYPYQVTPPVIKRAV